MLGRTHKIYIAFTLILFFFSTVESPAVCSEEKSVEPLKIPRTNSVISLDGVLDEEAWESALTFELLYLWRPFENERPPVDTEVLVTHNDHYLYVGFRAFDPDPSQIRARFNDRDDIGWDDRVGIVLDTFNDERRMFYLLSNPLGVQCDLIESPSGGGYTWDTIYDTAGRITDWGFCVEMAIPFSSLPFQRVDGPQIWGFDAVRNYAREYHYYMGTHYKDRKNNCWACQMHKIIGFEGIEPGNNVEIIPTVTTVRSDERSSMPNGEFEPLSRETELGVTARWAITPNMLISGTLNPDFSQVEADSLQLDINEPFALYYDEKRPFFVEANEFFTTRLNAVYTRTMRDPSWGAKLTGKEAGNTIGAFVVEDELTNLIFPGSQGSTSTSLSMNSRAAVIRYKRDIGNRYTLGVLGTAREGEEYHNRVLGFDGDFRITRTDRISVQFLNSNTDYPDAIALAFNQNMDNFDDSAFSIAYQHWERPGLTWSANYEKVGEDFRADLGFMPRVGYSDKGANIGYTWRAKPGQWWSGVSLSGSFSEMLDNDDNLLFRDNRLSLEFTGTLYSTVLLQLHSANEAYNVKEFDLKWLFTMAYFQPTRYLFAGFTSNYGDRIDYSNTRLGDRFSFSPFALLNIGRHFFLDLDYTFMRMNVEGIKLFTANTVDVQLKYQFNIRTFLRGIFQYVHYSYNPENYLFPVNPQFKSFFSQVLFSYKINPRTVFFLGYTDNYFGRHEFGLTQSDRTVFAKIGYAWRY